MIAVIPWSFTSSLDLTVGACSIYSLGRIRSMKCSLIWLKYFERIRWNCRIELWNKKGFTYDDRVLGNKLLPIRLWGFKRKSEGLEREYYIWRDLFLSNKWSHYITCFGNRQFLFNTIFLVSSTLRFNLPGDLLAKMFRYRSQDRIKISEVIFHPWFALG